MQIRKTPIVVNDSRGFYTSRVIGTMVNEGLAMLGEGVHPMSVERAATQAGYPVGTLQLSDELNMELMAKIAKATADAAGAGYAAAPRRRPWWTTMIEEGRPGRLRGAGFYDYDENGRRGSPVAGPRTSCSRRTPSRPTSRTSRTATCSSRRIETAKCFEEGVIESAAAANIGSIMGIGYPALTGGTVQFMQGYDGRDRPAACTGFVARAERARREVRRPLRPDRPAGRDGREGRVLPRLTAETAHPVRAPAHS